MDFLDRFVNLAERGFKVFTDFELGQFELDLIKQAKADERDQAKALAPAPLAPTGVNMTALLIGGAVLVGGIVLIKKL